MHKNKYRSQNGASIIEILVVLAIVGVIVGFAVVRFSGASKNLQRQNIAREFKVSLERARFDSVKRRANVCAEMSRVTISSPTLFAVTTDLNQNGRLDAAETQSVDFGGSNNDVTIVGNEITLPITIRFDERGNAVLSDCVTPPPPNVPLLYFCSGSCTPSTANAQNSSVLFVSPTGTVAMLNGGESMPSFANPPVSNVNSNSQINPLLAVWAAATPTPTPSPNPSPTPTPSPVPTATPHTCPSESPYEKPSVTGCVCVSPQWVRGDKWCK